jgi:RNA polymerase sigma-70 factor (ECF subfamily)
MELIKYEKKTVFQEDVLLQNAAGGDSHAFGKLYSHYHPKIFKFINGMLNSREDSEEILHDIFADLWERKHTLTEVGSLNSYLYKMAKYKLINLHEHRKVRQKADVYLEYAMEGSSGAADEDLIYRNYKAIFTDAMDLLPAKRRQIFEMRNLQELSHDEIAAELNISKSMVKKQCYAATRHIKEYLFRKAGLIATYAVGFTHTLLFLK